MEHQYPGPVGGDEHMLAELMLPDQTHLRSQDWTVFFLHKDAAAEEEGEGGELGRRRKKRRKGGVAGQAEGGAEGDGEDGAEDVGASNAEEDEDEDDDDDPNEPFDGPPLVYVLNLVNTKQDHTVKRGAVVKAMAICTRHSFLHIYKPLLLIALEQYFANPQIETLASLYDAVNDMDLSLMPRLTTYERFILQSSDAKDLFLEKFEAIIAQRMAESRTQDESSAPEAALQQYPSRTRYGLPRDTHEFESIVRYANIPVPVKIPVALSPETVGDFSLVKLITTFSAPHATTPQPFTPTHPHLTTSGPLTHPIIVLLNALLTQKRVIFLGHNLPSCDVAEAVLGACALASGGLLRGFTRHAFPYTDLTKIEELLRVPGFIAGVTNPAFAHKTEWWDLLCDLSTGRMRISNRIEKTPITEGVLFFQQPSNFPTPSSGISSGAASAAGDATGDQAFMAGVVKAIEERHGEAAIRSRFRRWVLKFTRVAAAFEELVYGASVLHVAPSPQTPSAPFSGASPTSPDLVSPKGIAEHVSAEVAGHGYVWASPQAKSAELAANATRIEGWRMTRSYYNFIQDNARFYEERPNKHIDLQHLHDKLAKLRLGHEVSAQIYLTIAGSVYTEAEINELLAVVVNGSSLAGGGGGGAGMRGEGQGLFYLGLGLFHPRQEVREAVAGLLGRIQDNEAGRLFWRGVGRFVKGGWERVVMGMRMEEGREDEG